MFSFLHRFHHGSDLAIDFGTALLRTGDDRGMRLPAVPSSEGPRPALRDGVVVDPAAAAELLRGTFREWGRQPRVLACAPSDASEAERLNLLAALQHAGAMMAAVIPEPVAALVGAGADIGSGKPHMLVDFGEGVVDCAVVAERQLHASVALRGGCAALRTGLASHFYKTEGVRITSGEAERLIRRAGLLPDAPPAAPAAPAVVREFLQAQIGGMTGVLLRFMEMLRAEVAAEVISNGIVLTGGGALIPGLAGFCARQSGLPFSLAPRPLDSVIDGACAILGPTVRLDLWDALPNFWNRRACPAAGRDL